jgi:hypothetical protein
MTIVMYFLDQNMTIVMLQASMEENTMGPRRLARLVSGRIHYAWIVVAVMFTVILATVGVRAAPGVLIVPLEQAFGWDAATISGAISLNILLGGLVGPFGAALIQRIGLRGTVLSALRCSPPAPLVPRSRHVHGSFMPLGAWWWASARAPAWSAWRRRWQIAGSSHGEAWWSGC